MFVLGKPSVLKITKGLLGTDALAYQDTISDEK
jgi:hypothetical protein